MLKLGCLVIVLSLAWLAASQPVDSEDGWIRIQRGPGRMMIVRNYLLRTPGGHSYDHQASMSAFAASSLSSGSFYGGPSRKPGNRLVDEKPPAEEEEEEDQPEETPEDKPEEEDTEQDNTTEKAEEEKRKPKAPRVAPKAPKIPKRRVMAEDDDDDDEEAYHDEEDNSPRSKGRKNQDIPTYANFFPIVFRSSGGSRRRSSSVRGMDGDEDEGSNPGLIAISNSFSQGRGAIATSTSTAYGGSGPASMPSQQYRKSSPSRYRS